MENFPVSLCAWYIVREAAVRACQLLGQLRLNNFTIKVFTYYSLFPPSSFWAIPSIKWPLISCFFCSFGTATLLRLWGFLLGLVEHHPLPPASQTGSRTTSLSPCPRIHVGPLILLCTFQSFLNFAVTASFQPEANYNSKLKTPFSIRHFQFLEFFGSKSSVTLC